MEIIPIVDEFLKEIGIRLDDKDFDILRRKLKEKSDESGTREYERSHSGA